MKTTKQTEKHLQRIGLALLLGSGLAIGSAQAQTIIEVGGSATIGTEALIAPNKVPAGGVNWKVTGNNTGIKYSGLVSPAVAVANTGAVTLTFEHRYNFEEAGDPWDGGAVFVSINGGAFTYVPLASFSSNGYVGPTTANAGSAWEANGEDVFYGQSAGYSGPALITSVANLGTLNATDTVAVEFRGGWDGAVVNGPPAWEIGTVTIADTGATLLDADFTADGNSNFTVANIGAVTAPWTYVKPINRFEIDGDAAFPLEADKYAPDVAGSVINLNGAKISVVLSAGTLNPSDTFTLFDLSGGTTLTGSIESISLPVGTWNTSNLATNGTITYVAPVTPTSQLGILNLAANGGINPNTGVAWAIGDQYRLAFVTNSTTLSTSNNINFYRNFVTAQAWTVPALVGSYWQPMITLNTSSFYEDEDPSAPILKVKDITGTGNLTGGAGVGGAGQPVYVVDGTTCIARNNADIWDGWSNGLIAGNTTIRTGSVYYSPYLTQLGTQPLTPNANHGVDVATGCDSAGNTVRPLGTSANVLPYDMSYGSSNANNAGRVWNRFGSNSTSAFRLYAISHPLTIYDANELVLPTLASSGIVDGQGGANSTLNVAPIVYTVTFSEVIDGSTLETTDFGSAGTATYTIDSIRGTLNPLAFEVTVTPTSTGTVQLQVISGAVISDLAGNDLVTTSAITDDTTITVVEDVIAPTAVFTDNTSPLPALTNSKITYTVTFSENMDVSTINASDFAAVGSAAGTIDSVSYFVDSKVWKVVVSTPATAGTLTLEIAAGAEIKDFVGNLLDTSSAVADDTTITVNLPVATTASLVNDFQATIASENHPTYAGEARFFHVSVNPANAGTGSYAATVVGTVSTPAPVFVRNYDGPVLSYKFAGGANNVLGVGMEGGTTSLITHATKDFVFDGFGQQQAKVWDATNPGAALATGGADPYAAVADKNAGLFRSLGGATGTINISGLASGAVHIYYGSFDAKPSLRVTMRDLDNVAANIVIANAHSIAGGGNDDTANRTELYLAEIDFVTEGFYDVIEYEWLANGVNYTGNGRGFGTVLTGPVAGYSSWASTNTAGVNLNDDHDNDGVQNGVEYFLGGPTGITTGFTPLPAVAKALDGTLSVTWLKGSGYVGDYDTHYVVETSTTLTGIWTVETLGGGNITNSASEVKYTFPGPLTNKKFARLRVTGP